MSSSTAAAAATAAAIAAIAAGYAAGLSAPPAPPAAAAAAALPALPARPTRAMTALSLLAPRRVPVLRPGRTLNTTRPSNLEALLGQYVGQVNAVPCGHCQAGSGVWTECVSVAGFFDGSCCNCHYGSEGSRCSLRPVPPAAPAPAPAPAPAQARPLRGVAPRRRIVDQVAPGNSPPPHSPSPRRRRPAPATTGQVRLPRPHTPATRARRLAELFGELAALFAEEAEVLEEEERTEYSLPETEREESLEL